jgi:hypothetical protein
VVRERLGEQNLKLHDSLQSVFLFIYFNIYI